MGVHSQLNPRLFVGAQFGSLTVLAIGDSSKAGGSRDIVCACSKYRQVYTVKSQCLLSGDTKSGSHWPLLYLPPGLIVDEAVLPLLPKTRWRLKDS